MISVRSRVWFLILQKTNNMNRIKISIKDKENYTVFRMGSSVMAKIEYSDREISEILQDLSQMIKHELKRDIQKTHKQLQFDF